MAVTWTDALCLDLLDRLDRGESANEISRSMSELYGTEVSRSSILGQSKRLRDAVVPSSHDGTCPSGWWRKGLALQQRRDDAGMPYNANHVARGVVPPRPR